MVHANVLKRNCKAHFDADRTTRPPWLHQSSVCMSHQGTEDPTSWTANLSNKWRYFGASCRHLVHLERGVSLLLTWGSAALAPSMATWKSLPTQSWVSRH